MNVIAYARFSSSQQQDGSSLERQFERIDTFAASRGYEITERVTDEGKSAFKAKHKAATAGLGRILAGVASGYYGQNDVLIVEDFDRLSREEPFDAVDNIRMMTRAGMTIEVIQANMTLTAGNYETSLGHLIQLLAGAALAHQASKQKSEILTKTWKIKRERGELRSIHPFWLDADRNVIEERAADVRMIFDLAERGLGRMKIAHELTAAGRKPWGSTRFKKDAAKQNADWCAATVSKVLRNRAVLGECQPMSKDGPAGPVELDYYPRIISTAQFERVHRVEKRKFGAEGSGRIGQHGNIFKGLLTCDCGRSMQMVSTDGKRYLRCSGALKKVCTSTRKRSAIRYDILEPSFLRAFKEMRFVDRTSDRKQQLQDALAEATRELEVTRENIQTLTDALLETKLKSFTQRIAAEEEKADELSDRITKIKAELAKTVRTLDDERKEVVNLFEAFNSQPAEKHSELRQQINQVLLRIVKSARMLPIVEAISVVTNDLTVYSFVYELRPDAQPRKVAGMKPATDYHWRAVRTTLQEAVEYQQPDADFIEQVLAVEALKAG